MADFLSRSFASPFSILPSPVALRDSSRVRPSRSASAVRTGWTRVGPPPSPPPTSPPFSWAGSAESSSPPGSRLASSSSPGEIHGKSVGCANILLLCPYSLASAAVSALLLCLTAATSLVCLFLGTGAVGFTVSLQFASGYCWLAGSLKGKPTNYTTN